MRILISGAGIAGLAAGLCLNQTGHDITIVEKAPSLRDDGYMIDFFGAGYDASERIGILDKLAEIHYPISRLVFLDGRGLESVAVAYPVLRNILGNRHFNFMRGELERVLYFEIADAAPIRFSTRINWLHFQEEKVSAEFTDGGSETFDLVIGADGTHSNVRQLIFGEEERFARFLGYYTAAFIINQSPESLDIGNAFYTMTEPGRQVGVYPIRGNRLATFFIYKADRPIEAFSSDSAREELHRVYGSMGWIIPELLEHSENTSIYFDEVSQIELPGWSRGRVVLLGDACQCVSPMAGQGASLAVAGAYVLARELTEAPNEVLLALARYQQKMKPHVEAIQKAGRRIAKWFVPESRWRLAVRNNVLRLADSSPGQYFFKRFLSATSGLSRELKV